MSGLFPMSQRHDRGAVIPMVALSLTVLMTMTAFAVDLGRMRVERRDLQADADAIALDAVQAIQGLTAAAAQPAAEAEAALSAARNDVDPSEVQSVRVGRWDSPTQTFTAPLGGTDYPNAVEVLLTNSVRMFFDLSTAERAVSRRGVAVATGQARAQLGSVLAGLELYDPLNLSQCQVPLDLQLSLMNRIYSELLGINVIGGVTVNAGDIDCGVTGATDGLSLDLASWKGVASGTVDLFDVSVRMRAASPDELLDSSVLVGELLSVTAQSLQSSDNATDVAAGAVIAQIAAHVQQDLQVVLGDVFAGNVGSASPGAADFQVNVLELLMASAMAIDGNNFATIEVPVNLPGAATSISPRIAVINPPVLDTWKRQGDAGPSTSQVRVALDIPLTSLPVDLPLLGGLIGTLGANTSAGSLSLVVDVARANSTYGPIQCSPAGKDASMVDLTVDTGAVTLAVGAISETALTMDGDIDWAGELSAPPLLHGNYGVSVIGLGLAHLDLLSDTDVAFDVNLLGATEPWTFTGPYATDYHRYDGGLSGTTVSDQIRSNLDLSVTTSPLNLLGTTEVRVEQLVAKTLKPVLDSLQPQLLDPLLSALGVTVAGADGRIQDVRCQVPALANRD